MKHYECSNCKYRIAEIDFLMARFDYPCPKCHKVCFSFFNVVEDKK